MSIRYGQKISNLADKQIASAFTSFNRGVRPKIPVGTYTSTSPTYTRPSDYIAIPSISSSEQKVVLLVSVYNTNSNFLAFTVAGNYTVDWGDGVIENFSSGVAATHVYDYSTFDPSNSTLTSQGFKQALVIITPQAGQNLTSLNFQTRHPSVNVNTHYTQPLVELYLSCPSLTSITMGTISNTTAVFPRLLEYANLINLGNVASTGSCFRTMGIKKCDIGKTSALWTDAGSMFNSCAALQTVTISSETNTSNLASMFAMFSGCNSLTSVPFFNTANVTNMGGTFVNCFSLTTVPAFDTAKVTSMSQMFSGCYNIKTVPFFNTAAVTNMSLMFQNCYSLTSVPLFNTAAVTTMASMFLNCYSLTSVPLFNTRSVTDMSSMFSSCAALPNVPLFDTANVTNMQTMFNSCSSLSSVPLFDTSKVTNMQGMFQTCASLPAFPLFNTSAATNMSSMFLNCYLLKEIPLFNTSNVTNMSSMFNGCISLVNVPLFNTVKVTNMQSMFQSCSSLITVPLFNTAAVNNMINMFQSCSSLITVPLFNTAAVTTMGSMFRYCTSLQSVPLFNTASVTGIGAMFQDNYSLREIPFFNTTSLNGNQCLLLAFAGSGIRTIPAFNFSAATTGNNQIFSGCLSLISVPTIDVGNITDFASTFLTCPSLASVGFTNIKYSISFAACNLSKQALETIFTNLGTAAAGATRTITLTNNWGAPTPVSLTGTTTAGLTTITMSNTTGLASGMQVTGTNTPLTTGIAVTFTDAGDTVNLNNHGLSNGDEVSFATITTTTGIVINVIYFVVNATLNTFQVASTLGGAALPLTSNGSGTLRYNSTIVSIVANTSVTMSRPMVANGAATLSFQQLGTYKAILKGFAITG